MQKTAPKPLIEVRLGPHYHRDIQQLAKQHPSVSDDVAKLLEDVIKPAVTARPLTPHELRAGTPVIRGTYHVRVANSSADDGKSGGFRLLYHWNRQDKTVTLLRIRLRKDQTSWDHRAVAKLVKEIAKKPSSPPA